MDFTYSIWILLLPLISFLVIGLPEFLNKKYAWSHKTAGLIGTCSLGLVTVLSYFTAFQYFTSPRLADGTLATFVPYNFTWLPLGHLHFDLGILLDPISVMMLIVISTVSLMVHIYSFGYMHGEKGFQRYYAFLSLFTMSMLGLVLATNIFQMYMFWELVGVSSYLLIGFYYTLHAAVHASKKAFIVTRFADMFFLIGILIFGYYTGSYNFSFAGNVEYLNGVAAFTAVDSARAVAAGGFLLPTALVLMFIGGAGKSAMFPLHIWLPDAMEGPTPVSALIHAATMVVAGVFQIARMFPIWIEYAPQSLDVVVVVGAFTAFYAAAVACAQSDIKRVLAFSTISQIAFMMVALGVCLPGHHGAVLDNHAQLGYMASMFHLFTHAMFKACLFLGAGCIIHAVHSNEMSTMGGLRKYMPITHITFLISCLAIAGIPFFSGFSSKDEIITACFEYSPVCGWWMTGVAAMTAFYMFRLYYGIFWGTENKELHAHHTPHEAPAAMTFPLVFLSIITVGVGVVTTLGGFLNWEWASFGKFVSAAGTIYTVHFDPQVAATSTVIAILSIALATYIYKGEKQPIADKLYATFPRLHRWAYKRFYMDEVYQFVTHKILFRCVSRPAQWIDEKIINGLIDFTAWGANEAGETIRPWQSGDVRQYAVWFLTGAVALTLLLLCL
ncbi:MAG: NADH-quinone oxidoreductase subunit L [Prevotella sp.]|nr:NADH-quinone oxidoreductase subunit L [Prevotella sp.]MCI7250429.1 NADH-quinone oxidoreductase subunit L [Prevotella sp.]MCI7284043.1 NADH-quinone oxidoreductase subunit L [Prevotella sp.]MDY3283245.1 NADH-quinone oxidoreductase subunit L [Prevotella sp.]MEE1206425.1 NADH-quinone oxidoreductase subunit L [Prevotella sp.]